MPFYLDFPINVANCNHICKLVNLLIFQIMQHFLDFKRNNLTFQGLNKHCKQSSKLQTYQTQKNHFSTVAH